MNCLTRAVTLVVAGCFLGATSNWADTAEPRPPVPFLHAAGTAIADEQNQPVVLRGCNFGNWLLLEPWMWGIFNDNFKDQAAVERTLTSRFGAETKDRLLNLYREGWITSRDFEAVKSWGFNVVRLPFNGSLLEDDAHPGELRPDAFRWLDKAVGMARQAGVYVILDLHGAPGGQSVDGVTGQAGRNQFWKPENRQRGAFLWQKLAEHFRDEPTVAAYDLLNEPYGQMNSQNHDADLVGAMDEMIHAVRQVDERHLIFCSGSLRGIEMYGNPAARGWKNVGFTEHFYPGIYGGVPSLETHARFLGANLGGRADLLTAWNAPYFAGEFNVVFDKAGGAAMMRKYYDLFKDHRWAATLWAYKLVKAQGGVQPDHWYMVTNADPLQVPNFATDSLEKIEGFCRAVGTMDYAQSTGLHEALDAAQPPTLLLGHYAPVRLPDKRPALPGWADSDVSDAFPPGGSVSANGAVEIYGGGRDIYEGSDEFHFLSRQVGGDFALSANVTAPLDTHEFAKSGLMFRASLAPEAPFVMINLFPDGRCVFAYRTQPGQRIAAQDQLRFDPGTTTLALRRRGTTFEVAALDAHGMVLGSKSFDLPGFGKEGQVGFFVLSHDAMLLSKASFSHIKLDASSNPTRP